MFIELCFNFMSILHIYPSCGQVLFPCLPFGLSCAILLLAGLLEVPATYLGSLGYFLAQEPVLLNGCPSEKPMLMGGGPECVACLAWFHTLSMCTLPPQCWQLSTRGLDRTCPEQDHNLHGVALNYPCPVGQLRIVRHNGTKHRENGIREQSYFYLYRLCRSQHIFRPWTETGPPWGPTVDIFDIGGGCSRISVSASRGARYKTSLR
jgi:hypothetical protein